jgi:hypothetical protein
MHHSQEQRFFITNHPQFNEQNSQSTNDRKYFYTYTEKEMGHIYLSLIHKVTNLFKRTNINIAFRASNTIFNQLHDRTPRNKTNSSGIYRLQCKTCSKSDVRQTGRSIAIRNREHTRYIKTNNPISAYAVHILNNRHEYGSP